jgi:hypothetical protein
MSDNLQNPSDQPNRHWPPEPETENLRALYFYIDTPGDTTRRPARGPIATQLRPDEPPPPPPPPDKEKKD